MHTCKIDKSVFNYPSSWDQLSRNQLLYLVAIAAQSFTETELKLKSFLAFNRLRLAQCNPIFNKGEVLNCLIAQKKQFWVTNIQLTELANSLDFIFEKKNNEPVLSSRLTINHFKELRIRFRKFYGPADKLFNLTLEEYVDCEQHFADYGKTQDMHHIDLLIATLWRPRRKQLIPQTVEDIRVPYAQPYTTAYCTALQRLHPELKIAILLYYSGCRKFLEHKFPDVFKSGGTTAKDDLGMLSLVDALCGDDVTKVEQVRKSYLYDVMIRLQRAAVAHAEMKEQMKKNK